MLLPPPIPSPISFQQILLDPSSTHTRDIIQADAARAKVRTVLKATRKVGKQGGKGEGGDWNAGVKATAEYIPYLQAIIRCTEVDDLLFRTDPVFTWRATLTSRILKKDSPKVSLPSFTFELANTILAHGICLLNRAASLAASLGTYETSTSVSTQALEGHSDTLNSAAEMLCRASGVFKYLEEVVLPKWERDSEKCLGRPVDLSNAVIAALSNIALADANLLAIRRLLSRSVASAHSSYTNGPPLSSAHPSPSLLAKLNLNVHNLYDESRSLVKSASRTSSSPESQGEVIPEFSRYLSDGRAFALGLSYKWLGIDAGENGGRNKSGECLCWLGMAKDELEQISKKREGLRGLKAGSWKIGAKAGKGRIEQELNTITVFLSAYKKVNDTLHYQTVPAPSQLQPLVPAGRAALASKPFTPPPLAFQPLSSAVSYQAPEDLHNSRAPPDEGNAPDSSDEDEPMDGQAGEYFGSGSYF